MSAIRFRLMEISPNQNISAWITENFDLHRAEKYATIFCNKCQSYSSITFVFFLNVTCDKELLY